MAAGFWVSLPTSPGIGSTDFLTQIARVLGTRHPGSWYVSRTQSQFRAFSQNTVGIPPPRGIPWADRAAWGRSPFGVWSRGTLYLSVRRLREKVQRRRSTGIIHKRGAHIS